MAKSDGSWWLMVSSYPHMLVGSRNRSMNSSTLISSGSHSGSQAVCDTLAPHWHPYLYSNAVQWLWGPCLSEFLTTTLQQDHWVWAMILSANTYHRCWNDWTNDWSILIHNLNNSINEQHYLVLIYQVLELMINFVILPTHNVINQLVDFLNGAFTITCGYPELTVVSWLYWVPYHDLLNWKPF